MPRYPHAIRLRGPWEYSVLEQHAISATAGLSAAVRRPASPRGRCRMPADWGDVLGREFRGTVRYVRHFHRPRGLDPTEHVWLVCEGVDAFGHWRLNDVALPSLTGYACPSEADITELLTGRNWLEIDVCLPPTCDVPRPGRSAKPGGLIGEVRLEVRGPQWLEDVEMAPLVVGERARIRLSGRVAGQPWQQPLGLSLVELERGSSREIAFVELTEHSPFALQADLADWQPWPDGRCHLGLRLIAGGRAVYETERIVGFRPVAYSIDAAGRAVLSLGARSLPPLPWPVLVEASQITETSADQHHAWYVPEIWPESVYQRFDEIGVAVTQFVPRAWAGNVCRRLAHHPSIVAWAHESLADDAIAENDDRPRLLATACSQASRDRPSMPQ